MVPVGPILHSGLEIGRPLGVEDIAHPVSPVLKPEPVIRTLIFPTSPTVGNKSIFAVTVKVALPTSNRFPVTVTTYGPGR